MSRRADRAVACFDAGFSSAQAICQAYGEEFGLSRETAGGIAAGLGAGVARTDNLCGAVSGAILIIGLALGGDIGDPRPARMRTYTAVQDFIAAFTAAQGSISCTALLGYNLHNPEEVAMAHASGAVARVCPVLIRTAADLLEEMLSQREE